jgi:hypothetical protein
MDSSLSIRKSMAKRKNQIRFRSAYTKENQSSTGGEKPCDRGGRR